MAETTSTSSLKVGQYYYNLETYPGVDSNIQLFFLNSKNEWQSTELVGDGQTWYKLGIQAPVGTQVEIDEKSIMIGRSGIYELDDGITIKSLKFIQPVKYTRDDSASNEAKEQGIAQMNEAKSKLDAIYENGNDLTPEQLNEANAAALSYNEGYKKYMQGENGIYTKGEIVDLKNVVIDFTYTTTNTVVEGE